MKYFKFTNFILAILCISVLLSGCSLPKVLTGPVIEPNAQKRAQQNVRDGRGIQLFKGDKKANKFLFASSNPLWRAALDTVSFISLTNADYSGGIIITDWYSEDNSNEAIKITIRFLSNEIRADGILVSVYKRTCINNNCSTKEIKNNLVFEIKDKILRKAANYKRQDEKVYKKNRPAIVYKGDRN